MNIDQIRLGDDLTLPESAVTETFAILGKRDFVRRNVSLGTCGRAYGTSCQHEQACIRCSLLRTDPAQLGRLEDIARNLKDRVVEAHQQGWIGEAESLEISLDAARIKLGQIRRQLEQGLRQ